MREDVMSRARVFGSPSARVLLVGEAPNRRMHVNESEDVDALVIPRLLELTGLGDEDYRALFARTNLLLEWPGPSREGKGDEFPFAEARAQVARLKNREVMGSFSLVVFVGRRAASCFYPAQDRDAFPWFHWDSMRVSEGGVFGGGRSTYVATAPHPSGISTWWDDPKNVIKAETFWRHVVVLARHASEGRCGLDLPRHLVEGLKHRFPCDDRRDYEAEGVPHEYFSKEGCPLVAGALTDGFRVEVRLSAGREEEGVPGWGLVVKKGDEVTRIDAPTHVLLRAYGKSGSERIVLSDAFEWIAKKLREVPS